MTRDELARAIVALPGWRWMPEMRVTLRRRTHTGVPAGSFVRLLCLTRRRVWLAYDERGRTMATLPAVAVQRNTLGALDLTDAATGGCLLVLLSQGEHRVSATCRPDGVWWVGERRTCGVSGEGATLAEACARVALALGRWPDGGS